MRKFLSTTFTLLIATNVWASSITIECQNRGDYECIATSALTKTTKCNSIPVLNNENYVYLDVNMFYKCAKKLHTSHNSCTDAHLNNIGLKGGGYIRFCDNNQNIQLVYTNEETDNWSYAQKRCVGSSGDWKNGQCTCDQDKIPGTTLHNGECICANKTNQKYFNKLYTGCEMLKNGATLVRDNSIISGILNEEGSDTWDIASIDRANSCDITGGDRQGNKCNCESRLNLEPNASEYYCNCKEGTDYKKPLYKNEGCIPITDIPDYDTVNFAQDIHTEPEPPVEPEKPKPKEPVIDETAPDVPTPLKPTATELEDKLKAARDALNAAQDKENSWANRAVSAVSTAASGVGAMEAASALAERNADEDAEAEMQEYISTMKCEYGKGQQFNLGPDEITLPGGNELFEYYTEYKTLANNLKTTKAALGLRPGIENEVLYDRAQSGLYQYSNAERQSGGETSLYRALTDTESADATAWNDQKDASTKKLYIGGGAAAVGVVGGAAGNYFINRDKKENDTKK